MKSRTEDEIKKGAEQVQSGGVKKPTPNKNVDIPRHQSDNKGNGKTAQDPRASQKQERGKSRDSQGSQTHMRNDDNRENRSPNLRSAAPSGLESENPTGFHLPSQHPTAPTSAPKNLLWQNWEDSKQHQPAQQRSEQQSQDPTPLSQAAPRASSFDATGNVGATHVGGRGTPYPSTSQASQQRNQAQAQNGRLTNVSSLSAAGYF